MAVNVAYAQGPSTPPVEKSPASQPTPAAAESGGINTITRAGFDGGVLGCASRINQVTKVLGFGPQAGAVLMLPPSQPDERVASVSMEIPTDGGTAYVSASFAPNQANGCGAVYDAVVYWPLACDAVATAHFADLKRIGLLKKDLTLFDGGGSTKVFLMKAGNGCISIKKELIP